MKKINLRGITEILSEKEMKNVMGGGWPEMWPGDSCMTGGCDVGAPCNSGSVLVGRCDRDSLVGICTCK